MPISRTRNAVRRLVTDLINSSKQAQAGVG
jgi:hypothetical protein